MKGKIHSVETFGTVDGPGIRYVIFFQGCINRCAYCHNPDTWDETKGEEYTVDELVQDVLKYKRYIEGVTVSGGEPLLQMEFLTEFFKAVKKEGLTTCLDTSGVVFNKNDVKLVKKFDKLMAVCDLVLLDIKHINDEQHRNLTGQSVSNCLNFAQYLSEIGKDVWLRFVLVPTINDDLETLKEWKAFANTLNNVKKIEVLPYHTLGKHKYKELGIPYRLENVLEPTEQSVRQAKEILEIKEKIND